MGWEIRLAAGDPEAQNWLATHPAQEEAFQQFMHPG